MSGALSMTDEAAGNSAAQPPSAGALLRQLREAAGVSTGQVASALKVAPQKIEALEGGHYDLLPDATFARGLAAAICRALHADPAPVLALMPSAVNTLRPADDHVHQQFRRPGDRPAPMVATGISRRLLIAVFVFLAGAAALWLLPTLPIQLSAPPDAAAPEDTVHENAAHENMAPVPEPAPPEPPASTVPPVEAAAPATAVAADAAASAASAAAAGQTGKGVLGLSAKSQTWVSVRDARDKVLVNRTLGAGESLTVDGDLPLSVTIGRKDAVSVTVRGKPFEVKTSGASSVLRFTVK